MNFYLHDILTQPQELTSFLKHYMESELQNELKKLASLSVKKVIFSGMGSSHFCALSASIILKQHGIECEVISTGELLYYEQRILNENVLLCLISQSGESGEIVHLLEQLPENIKVVGITNNSESTLAKRSDFLFELFVSNEVSVTTRTYLSSFVVALFVAYSILGKNIESCQSDIQKIIGQMEVYLTNYEEVSRNLFSFVQDMKYVCVIGRGNSLTTVRAGSLFIREVVRFPALDFDSAEFRHGPMEMVDSNFYGIVLAPYGLTQSMNICLAQEIAKRGGHVILITDETANETLDDNIMTVKLPSTSEEMADLLQILPIQMLVNAMAEARNIPVGEFRWGSKITKEV